MKLAYERQRHGCDVRPKLSPWGWRGYRICCGCCVPGPGGEKHQVEGGGGNTAAPSAQPGSDR